MGDDRECTCHPDEAPVPCQKKYAFTECEITRLREENARLREVLKPFAEVAKYDIGDDEMDDDMFRPILAHRRAPRLNVGHLRAAAAAIREGEPCNKKEDRSL